MTRRAALVTGGAKRVGRAIALDLARRGVDIILHYHRSQAEAEATGKDILALGVDCLLAQADLTQPKELQALVSGAFEQMPHCDILINNASHFSRQPFLESGAPELAEAFAINLYAPIGLTQAFAQSAASGCVVNLLDTGITQQRHSHFFYLLAKKALAEFTRMAAAELAPGLRVNGLCPGYLLPSPGWGEAYQAKLEARLPLQRIATLEAVTRGVWSLIDNPAITGQLLFVDGGEHLL